MTNVVEFEMLFKNAQFIAGLLSGAAAQKKVTEEVGKTTKESRRAEQELSRFAAATKKLDASPYEKYTGELGKLKRALEAGKLEQIDYTRAVKRLQEQLKQADPGVQQMIARKQALQAAAEQEKKLAEAIDNRMKKRAADIGEANMSSIERYNAALAELTTLRDRHGLSQENFNRQLAREKQLLDAADPAIQKQKEALAAWQKQLRANSAELERAEDNLDRMADSIRQVNATPLEKYNREVAKLEQLHQRGKLSVDEYTRAVQRERMALLQTTSAAEELKSDGSRAIVEVASSLGMVTTVSGVAAAGVGLLTTALREAQEQAKKAGDHLKGLFPGERTLMQVAKGNTDAERLKDYQGMRKEYEDAGMATGVDLKTAQAIRSEARGAGFEGDYDEIMRGGMGVLDPAAASSMAKTTLGIYRDKDKNLTAMQTVNMGLAAAFEGNLSFEDVARTVANASEGGVMVGNTVEDTFAQISVFGEKFKSAEAATDRMKNFMAHASLDPRLKSLNMMDQIKAMGGFSKEDQDKILGDSQERRTILEFGSSEATAAEIARRKGNIIAARADTGTANDFSERAVQTMLADPQSRAVIEANKAAVKREVIEARKLGQQGLAQTTGADLGEAASVAQGTSWAGRFVGRLYGKAIGTGDTIMSNQANAQHRAMGEFGAGVLADSYLRPGSGNLLGTLLEAAKTLNSAAAKLEKAADKNQNIQVEVKTKPNIHAAANAEAAAPLN